LTDNERGTRGKIQQCHTNVKDSGTADFGYIKHYTGGPGQI